MSAAGPRRGAKGLRDCKSGGGSAGEGEGMERRRVGE